MAEYSYYSVLYQNSVIVAVVVIASASVILLVWLGPIHNSPSPDLPSPPEEPTPVVTHEEPDAGYPSSSHSLETEPSAALLKARRPKERRKRAKDKDRASNKGLVPAQQASFASSSSQANTSPSLGGRLSLEADTALQVSLRNSQEAPHEEPSDPSFDDSTPTIHVRAVRVASPSLSEATTATNTTSFTVQSSALVLTPPLGQRDPVLDVSGDLQLDLNPVDGGAPENKQKENLIVRPEHDNSKGRDIREAADVGRDAQVANEPADWAVGGSDHGIQAVKAPAFRAQLPPQPPSPPPPRSTPMNKTSSKSKSKKNKDRQRSPIPPPVSPRPTSPLPGDAEKDTEQPAVPTNSKMTVSEEPPSPVQVKSPYLRRPSAKSSRGSSPNKLGSDVQPQLPPRHRRQPQSISPATNPLSPNAFQVHPFPPGSSPQVMMMHQNGQIGIMSPPTSPHSIPSPYQQLSPYPYMYPHPQSPPGFPQPPRIQGNAYPIDYIPTNPQTNPSFTRYATPPPGTMDHVIFSTASTSTRPSPKGRVDVHHGSYLPVHSPPAGFGSPSFSISRLNDEAEARGRSQAPPSGESDHPPNLHRSSPQELDFPTLNPSKSTEAHSVNDSGPTLRTEEGTSMSPGEEQAAPGNLFANWYGSDSNPGSPPARLHGGYPMVSPPLFDHLVYEAFSSHQQYVAAQQISPLHRHHSPGSHASMTPSPSIGMVALASETWSPSPRRDSTRLKHTGLESPMPLINGKGKAKQADVGASSELTVGDLGIAKPKNEKEQWQTDHEPQFPSLSDEPPKEHDAGSETSSIPLLPNSPPTIPSRSRSGTGSTSSSRLGFSRSGGEPSSPSPSAYPPPPRLRTTSGNHLAGGTPAPLNRQTSTPSPIPGMFSPTNSYSAGSSPLTTAAYTAHYVPGPHAQYSFAPLARPPSTGFALPPSAVNGFTPFHPVQVHQGSMPPLPGSDFVTLNDEYGQNGSPRRPASRSASSTFGSTSSQSGSPQVYSHPLPMTGYPPHTYGPVPAPPLLHGYRPALPQYVYSPGYAALPPGHPLASPVSANPPSHVHLLLSSQQPPGSRSRQGSGTLHSQHASQDGNGTGSDFGGNETEEPLNISEHLMEAILKNPDTVNLGCGSSGGSGRSSRAGSTRTGSGTTASSLVRSTSLDQVSKADETPMLTSRNSDPLPETQKNVTPDDEATQSERHEDGLTPTS